MLNPVDNMFPEEMACIGRMVLGYSEIDFSICSLAASAIGNRWNVLTALHSLRQEAARLEVIEHLSKPSFEARGLINEFEETIFAVKWCKKVRNHYAHATWNFEPGPSAVLLWLDVSGTKWPVMPEAKPTTLKLLKSQEAYFGYARMSAIVLALKVGGNEASMPPKIPQPDLHTGYASGSHRTTPKTSLPKERRRSRRGQE